MQQPYFLILEKASVCWPIVHDSRVTVIREFFGYLLEDSSHLAVEAASEGFCPFIGDVCTKTLHDGTIAGVCTLKQKRGVPVICCPNRLYANNYTVLHDIVERAFGYGLELHPGTMARHVARSEKHPVVAVWGKRWGGELHLPQRRGRGSYFVDWVLALLDSDGELQEFVAVEVQTIDTTGSYRDGIFAAHQNRQEIDCVAGFNWENVNKRILPQLLYKGHVLQRENRCLKGLFFVSPSPVFDRIMRRLGGEDALLPYPMRSSTITFMSYNHDFDSAREGTPVPLKLEKVLTTDTGQVAQAFAGPGIMPPANSYEHAILAALS